MSRLHRRLALSAAACLTTAACSADTLLVLKVVDPASEFAYAFFREDTTQTTSLDTANTCGKPFVGDLASWPNLAADPRWPSVTSGHASAPLGAGQSMGFPVGPQMQGKVVRAEVTLLSAGDELRWCGCVSLPTSGYLEVLVGGSYLVPPARCEFIDRQTAVNATSDGSDCAADSDCTSHFCGCGDDTCSSRHCTSDRQICTFSDPSTGQVLGNLLSGVADTDHCADCRGGSCPRADGTPCGKDDACINSCECLTPTCGVDDPRACGSHGCGTCQYWDTGASACASLADESKVLGRCDQDNHCRAGSCVGPSLGEDCTLDPSHCGASAKCVCADEHCTTRICGPSDCGCQYDLGGNGCDLDLAPGTADPSACNVVGYGCFARACKKLNGTACGNDLECGSGSCECGDAACSTALKRCSPVTCPCGFNEDGDPTCDGFLEAGTLDAHGGCGGRSCNGAGGCYLGTGQTCTSDAQCETLHCECANDVCSDKRCSLTRCDCKYDAQSDGTCEGLVQAGYDDAHQSCGFGSVVGKPLHCDGQGACRLDTALDCADDSRCESGFCDSGVCCSTLCDGSCQSCALTTGLGKGTCQRQASLCTGNCASCDPSGTCVADTGQCSGCAHCQQGANAQIYACAPVLADCGGEKCVSCLGAGTDFMCAYDAQASGRDCIAGAEACVASGECRLLDGQTCNVPADCVSGACECADSTCSGLHCVEKACNQCYYNTGVTGDCTAYVLHDSDDRTATCGSTLSCNGHGGCTLADGQTCSAANAWACQSSYCECGDVGCTGAQMKCHTGACATCEFATVSGACLPVGLGNRGKSCTDLTHACTAGSGPTACKLANGQLCGGADSACASGFCECGDVGCSTAAMRCSAARDNCGWVDTTGAPAGNLTDNTDPTGVCADSLHKCYAGACHGAPGASCGVDGDCGSALCNDYGVAGKFCCDPSGPCAKTLSGGDAFTCASLHGGGVRCWGLNASGQLGDGTNSQRLTPVAVTGITTAAGVAAGNQHACAWLSDNTAKCWGYNAEFELGGGASNHLASYSSPIVLAGAGTTGAILAGTQHTCRQRTTGQVDCWGTNVQGQMANGTTSGVFDTPQAVGGGLSFTGLAAGAYHGCVVLAAPQGRVSCWGNNMYGQIGNGDTVTPKTTLTAVSTIGVSTNPKGVAVAGGKQHTCAVLDDKTVMCWGDNQYSQVGNTGATNPQTTPMVVTGLANVLAVAAGGYHTCALATNGTVWCWGRNYYGQLGNSTTADSATPTQVGGLGTVAVIGAGQSHTCAVSRTGAVTCWGNDDSGQLGNGQKDFTAHPSPLVVGPWP